jgi:hypothetical protein
MSCYPEGDAKDASPAFGLQARGLGPESPSDERRSERRRRKIALAARMKG